MFFLFAMQQIQFWLMLRPKATALSQTP